MPIYFGTDDQGTQASSLQDFAPTGMQKMDAAVSEAWQESYGPVLMDNLAARFGGEGTRRLSAVEAQDYARQYGGGAKINLTPKDGEYTAGQWGVIVERQRRMAAIKDVRERTPWEMGSVARGAAMFGAGILDPLNLATAFVPWTRSISALRGVALTAEAGATLGARTGARAVLGAVDGGISTAVLEPFYYAGRQALGDDYSAYDSMANIAFGAAFGAAVVPLAGAAGDLLARRGGGADAPPRTPEAERVGEPVDRPAADPMDDVPGRVGDAVDGVRAGEPALFRGVRQNAVANELGVLFVTPDRNAAARYAGADGQILEFAEQAGGRTLDFTDLGGVARDEDIFARLADAVGEEAAERVMFNMRSDTAGQMDVYTITRDRNGVEALREAGIDTVRFRQIDGEGGDYETVAILNQAYRPARIQTASSSPETREAAMRAAVSQLSDGRPVDVDAIYGMESGATTADDVAAAADANFAPENQPLADFASSAEVQARVDSAPKWEALEAAEQAAADAKATLDAVVKAGDEAWKYSRKPLSEYGMEHRPMTVEGGASTLDDLTGAFGDDIYGPNALRFFGSGDPREREVVRILKSLRGKPDAMVTIYRGVPEGVDGINAGDWVTLSKSVAEDYGPNVLSIQVPASHVTSWSDALLEFGYYPPGAKYSRGAGPMANSSRQAPQTNEANGSALYARGLTGQSATDALTASIRASFGNATDALLKRGQTMIVATPNDIPGGPHPADVKGATAPDGTVYIVAENVSEVEARGMMLHEVGVHVGMREMLGDDVFQSVLSELDDAILRGESWAMEARARVPAETRAADVREEQLAYLVQYAPDLPIVQRIIAAIRAWAYRTFEAARERMTLTEADFRAMAVAALYEAARGRRAVEGGVPAFSRDVPQTETKAFRDWFGESKVVDGDGKPLVVYHGTKLDVSTFDIKKAGASDPGLVGKAFYFTPSAAQASSFAESGMYGKGGAPNVMPVYLSIRNPAVVQDGKLPGGRTLTDVHPQGITAKSAAAIRKELEKAGHDGAVFYLDGEPVQYVAFRPEQIKSAIGNRGTFDPTNPDIRYSRGETPDPSTAKSELQGYDDAIKRAKSYANVLRAAADKLDDDAAAADAMRAAMPDITPAEITSLLDELRKQVKGLRSMARTARTALTAEDAANATQDDAMRAADMLANNLQMAAVIEKRNASLNIAARMRGAGFLGQFRKPGLDFEGFRAMLVGTERRRIGGRLSIDAEQKQFRGKWLGGMIADLEAAGLTDEFQSGHFDREISQALWNFGGDGKGNEKLPAPAVQIAQVIHKYQQDARNTRNRFGAWIRDLQGYIARQSHDMLKIRDAGEKAWMDFVVPRLDIAKMQRLGLISEADPMASLRAMYDDFATGVHMKVQPDDVDRVAFGGANLARRVSASRTLYFKDGATWHEYNTKFGQGRLAELVLSGLDSAARDAGLLKVLGTNPEATLNRMFDEYAETLKGDPARRAQFLSKRKELENLLAQVDGSVNIPGSVTAAKWAAFSRSWMTMAKLGGMLISSITDLAAYAADMRQVQGKTLLGGVLDSVGSLARGRASGERKQILAQLGVFHESTLGAVYNRFDAQDIMGGTTAAAMQQFFKLTGINWWTESLRDGYALSHSHYLALNAGKEWGQLPEALRDMLTAYRIDEGKWGILRQAAVAEADGKKFMTPEGLKTVPASALQAYIRSVGREVNDASMFNLQEDLAGALRAMTIDRMHHAVLEPNARTRAFMLRGTQPGTVPGEFLRYIGQFKSFPVALVQSVLGREVYGRGYDTIGEFAKAAVTTSKGAGDAFKLATFIALSTAMGYAAMSAKDLLRGRNPRPIDDRRTWMAAFVQGGGLGIYGDFLFGQYNRMGSSLSGSMVGPVIGLGDTVADLWTRVRKGDDVAAAAFNAALANTPFMNIFYTRVALDYLILYQIQEALNPGFLRRMERRAQTEFGTSYYLPPSQVVN